LKKRGSYGRGAKGGEVETEERGRGRRRGGRVSRVAWGERERGARGGEGV